MVKNKLPKRGSIIWCGFDPTKGREQSGRRPAVVISNDKYNKVTNLIVVCPITSQKKGYYFEVEIKTQKIEGFALVNHIRSVDWSKRNLKIIDKISEIKLKEINEKLSFLLSE